MKTIIILDKQNNFEQIPNLASLPQSGHEAPDFVFIPK